MSLLEKLSTKTNCHEAQLAISHEDLRDAANRRYNGIFIEDYGDLSDMTGGERIRLRHDIGGAAFRLEALSQLAGEGPFQVDEKIAAIKELQANDHLDERVPSLESLRQLLFPAELAQETPLERIQSAAQYMAFWRLSYPETMRSAIQSPDAVYVQAFGRDSLRDPDLPRVRQLRDGTSSDVDAFLKLRDDRFEPGPSNQALAENTKRLVDDDSVEVALQWEVAYALWQRNPEWYGEYQAALHVLWPRPDLSSYRTYHVKEDSIRISDDRQLIGAYELAHPAMYARAVPIIRKLGQKAVAVQPMPEIPFDPHSTQIQVRSRAQWIPREFLTRWHHLLTGKVTF